MNTRIVALVVVALVLGGWWFSKSGKNLLVHEKQAALLKCERPECGEEFTMQLPIPFDKYPVTCPKCGEKTGYPLTSCGICGFHYALNPAHPLQKCPNCGAVLRN